VLEQHARQDQPQRHGHDDLKWRGTVRGDAGQHSSPGRLSPIEAGTTTALAVWNRKKPGIIETTAGKPSARAEDAGEMTGVTMTLTRMQTTSAPLATFAPASEISA
jgi:hypothetical protein